MKKQNLLLKQTFVFAFIMLLSLVNVKAQENKALFQAALQNEKAKQNWKESDVSEWKVSSQHTDATTGLTYAYIQQMHNGIPVYNAISVFALKQNAVAYFKPGLITEVKEKANADKAVITAVQALNATAQHLEISLKQPAKITQSDVAANQYEFTSTELSNRAVKVQLLYLPVGDKLKLVWEVSIEMISQPHWWNVRIDALTGNYIEKNDWTTHCNFDDPNHNHAAHDVDAPSLLMSPPSPGLIVPQYNVFPFPFEAPSFGSQTLLIDPADYSSSPFGWHDVDGVAGAEHTITRGNNVYAYEDADANNLPGYSPDGGAILDFNFVFNAANAPLANQNASITNLFYANNRIHDVLHHVGFTEAAGNFQQNNYGNGGLGNDPVLGEAFDGAGTNNANFATPADGQSGRMQMFLWTSATPDRDGSFDNGIIAHEFGHGLSNRLTGGPANSSCLTNAEQGGEGWSDWLGLIMSVEPGDTVGGGMLTQARGIGTYALNQATNGVGIRRFRYSVNMAINPQTYADVATSGSSPHQKGEIWCAAIWDMSCFLINDLGLNMDPTVATAGNNIAMRLVLEGMKLQPCNPGYLDARNAILLADHLLYNDAHCALIWQAFARRGMGVNAVQGSANSSTDQVADFTPGSCAPCAGAPEAGTAVTASTSVCAANPFSITLTGQSADSGIVYQWQSSPDDIVWTNMFGFIGYPIVTTQSAATYYRCKVTCTVSGIADTTNSVFIGFIPNCIIMSNNTTTTCSASFYDSGGPANNYSDNENFTQTLLPTPGNRIKIIWNSFASEANFDFITIYDGPDATAPILYGPLSGTLSIPTFVSSHVSGALTIRFTTDVAITAAGWNATVICDAPCNGPVVSGLDTVDICNGASTTLTITGGASGYSWSPALGLNQTTGTSVIASPTVSTTYTVTSNDDPTCNATIRVNVNATPVAPSTGNYSICQGGAITAGQGLTATSISGTFNTENKFGGSPYSSSGPATIVSTITLPALPAGTVITDAKLNLYNVTALGASFRSEFRVALSGDYTLGATQVSTLASAGTVTPDPVISLTGFPITGGTINLVLSESFNDAGVDATVDSVRIDLIYTVPPQTLTWWDAPTGGNQVGTGSPLDPIGSVALPNSNTPNNYTFYAQSNISVCESVRTSAVLTIVGTDDGDACTNDACDPITNTVTHTPVDCNDNNACTTETCDPLIGCIYSAINADDGNQCTIDACDPSTGVSHTPVSCNDNNACTTEVCNPSIGCVYTAINTDDGNLCTTDACDPSTGTINHTPVNTDDGDPCTLDGCDPVTGVYHTGGGTTTLAVGPISGTLISCIVPVANSIGNIYSVPAISGATFTWTVPTGMTIASGQGTNSIIVNWTSTAIHLGIVGQMCVNAAQGVCATGSTCANVELQYTKPVAPGSISGPAKVCPGDVVTYSIGSVSRASSYQWTLPANMSGSSTGTTITATVLAGFSGGFVSVQANNVCGLGTARAKSISLYMPNTPSIISGPIDGVCLMNGVNYSITGAVGATSYLWSASGATITGGQGTTSIMVNFPAGYISGAISVAGVNVCGTGVARTITVRSKPASPGLITGPSTVCIGIAAHYSVAVVPGTVTYGWTAPAGSIISGQGAKEVDITFTVAGTNRQVRVNATNSCGTSAYRTRGGIDIASCPRLGDATAENALSIYPNPAHNQLTMSFTADKTTDMVITLNDVIGRTVLTENKTAVEGLNTYQFDLTKIAKGLYLLQVEMNDRRETIKVVIE